MRPAAALAVALLAGACMSAGLSITPPPPLPPDPELPTRLSGEERPALDAMEQPGLYRARAPGAELYYFEPGDLWYRRWRGRWYQAFDWNGSWFPPGELPEALRALPASETTPR